MNKRKTKKILIYVLIFAAIFLPGTVKYYGLKLEKAKNDTKLNLLSQENKRLKEENKRLKEDPVYIEKMARENLGLAKPDEVVVKFVNQTSTKRDEKQ